MSKREVRAAMCDGKARFPGYEAARQTVQQAIAGMALSAVGGERAPAGLVLQAFSAVTCGAIAAVVTLLHESRPPEARSADELRAGVVGAMDVYLRQLYPDWHGSN